jgi:hypothetical protein
MFGVPDVVGLQTRGVNKDLNSNHIINALDAPCLPEHMSLAIFARNLTSRPTPDRDLSACQLVVEGVPRELGGRPNS